MSLGATLKMDIKRYVFKKKIGLHAQNMVKRYEFNSEYNWETFMTVYKAQ